MRNLADIIIDLLDCIPIDNQALRLELTKYKNCENTHENWNDVGDILYTWVFSDFYPEISWQSEVERIWTGDDEPDSLDYSNF